MLALRLIIIYIVIGISSTYLVEGLQCYVCEDCNEFEDFKELHICGEITTIKPVTLPESLPNANNGTTKTTIKPVHEDTEEYIYDDSLETHDDNKDGSSGAGQHKKRTKTNTEIRTTPNPTTTIKSTAITQVTGDDDYLEYDLTIMEEVGNSKQPVQAETTKKKRSTTTNKPTKQQQQETTKQPQMAASLSSSSSPSLMGTTPSTSSKPIKQTGDDDYLEFDEQNNSQQPNKTKGPTPSASSINGVLTASTPNSSLTGSQLIELTDYDDYLDYDTPSASKQRSVKTNFKSPRPSLLKIDEPVCYMIKFNVNNTVITNRGCTTLINANNYLTCQSLYNGAPMSSCRICTSDGCNKFLSDDDDNGLVFNAAGIPDKFSVLAVFIFNIIFTVVVQLKFLL